MKEKPWRPPEWERIKVSLLTDDILNQDDYLDRLSEAVADALLEALKVKEDTQYGELDEDIHANDFYFRIYKIGDENMGERAWEQNLYPAKGWLIFIPDK